MIITLAQAQNYAVAAGFKGSAVNTVVAIAQAESGLNDAARHLNTDGTTDRGILQINSVHGEVPDAAAYNAASAFQAAYQISNSGKDFTPWTTYTSGAYKRYLTANSGNTYKSGSRNIYASYLGQCTWWGAERYHQLTNVWVAWQGNANQWASGAQASGWQVSLIPPKGIGSIICLQPGVQGADGAYGHVAVVESVNNDGSIVASNMNWASGPIIQTVQGYPIRRVTFSPGSGVSFLYADASASGSQTTSSNPLLQLPKMLALAPNASVTQTLAALDQALALTNPFDVQNAQQDSIAGLSFTDPVSWLAGFGTNLVSDLIALVLRLFLLIIALFLLYRIVEQFVDVQEVAGSAANSGQALAAKLAPLFL